MFTPTAKCCQGTPLMVDYTPTVFTPAGSVVVIGGRIGIAHRDIPAGQLGALSVGNAVYDILNDGSAFTDRQDVYWLNQPAFSASSLTQSAGTATLTTTAAHGLITGQSVTISGAAIAAYNGTFAITVTGATTFTFAVPSATTSPAGGTPVGQSTSGGLATINSNGNTWIGFADGAQASSTIATATVRVVQPISASPSISAIQNAIADPGNAGAIPVTQSGNVQLVTAGAETRTIAAPSAIGIALLLNFKTKVGNCVITVASTINSTGNNTISLTAAGQSIELVGVQGASGLRWAVRYNDGTTLTTV